MGRKSLYNASYVARVREAGADGLAVTEAARRLGINTQTLANWERRHAEFREAAAGVRRNSAERALSRTRKLMQRSEDRLLQALAFVRAEKAAEDVRIQKAMAEGRMWTPQQLAAKIQNIKELRREARAKQRSQQRRQAKAQPVVALIKYQ